MICTVSRRQLILICSNVAVLMSDELLGWEVVGSLTPASAAERLAGESTY
jgi:hypothetical protein